jgi:hypothetical protein
MFTSQPIEPLTPRFRIKPGTAAAALGVLVAIAVTIMFLTLTGTNHHTTAAITATTSQAAATATPHTHYLGPRQQHAPTIAKGAASAAAGEPAARYACLGAPQRCLR